jgi:hypothetical protein
MAMFLASTFLTAASVRILSCSDSACGFNERICFGRTRYINQIFGMCYQCKRSTTWEWRNGFDVSIPKPITITTDPATGEKRKSYPCIRCNEPFIQVTDPTTIKKCPDCLKSSVVCGPILLFVD